MCDCHWMVAAQRAEQSRGRGGLELCKVIQRPDSFSEFNKFALLRAQILVPIPKWERRRGAGGLLHLQTSQPLGLGPLQVFDHQHVCQAVGGTADAVKPLLACSGLAPHNILRIPHGLQHCRTVLLCPIGLQAMEQGSEDRCGRGRDWDYQL